MGHVLDEVPPELPYAQARVEEEGKGDRPTTSTPTSGSNSFEPKRRNKALILLLIAF